MEKRAQGSLVSSNSDTDTNTQQRRLAPNRSNEVFGASRKLGRSWRTEVHEF
jgi:hypothetical protein